MSRVGRKLIFPVPMPDGTSTRGMTYEEYLIGQALTGLAQIDMTPGRAAGCALHLARAVTDALDRRRRGGPLPDQVAPEADMYPACESGEGS
jgi:hypothetical protein